MKTSPVKVLAAAAVALTLALTGCTSPTNDGGTASGGVSKLDQILESKTIRIAVPTEAQPWGILNSSGENEGFDVDIATALAASLDAKVEFVPAGVESRIPILQTDKADVLMAAFSALNQRAQQVELTIPYAAVGTVIAVKSDSSITSYDDLAGKTVSTSRGSTGEAILKQYFPDTEIAVFNSVADSVQALKSGKVDALIEVDTIINSFIASDPTFRVLDEDPLAPALITAAIKPGDQKWLNYLNTFIRNYNNSGENEAASQKWFYRSMQDFLR